MLLAQIPGAEEAIKTAARSGWLEVFVVVIVFIIIGTFAWVIKRILEDGKSREDRLADRITKLENEIRTELFAQLKLSAEVMAQVVAASEKMGSVAEKMTNSLEHYATILDTRPCLLSYIKHGKFLEELTELANHLSTEGN